MASLFHWPTSRMVSASMRPHSKCATSTQAAGVHVGQAKTDVEKGGGSSVEQGGDLVAIDMVPVGAHNVGAKGGH